MRDEGAKPLLSPTYVVRLLLLAKTFEKNQTWQVPTLLRLRAMQFTGGALYRTDPNLVYVEKTTRALWENLGQQYSQILQVETTEAFQAYYPMQQKLIRMFRKEGVKILAGSDLGGIWIVAGFSLHQEFRELASAGLSPLEALQATTLNAAIILKREATMESVEAGKNADVANLAKIFAVVNAGTLHSLPALEKMKRDVITAQASRPLQNMSAAIDTAHVH